MDNKQIASSMEVGDLLVNAAGDPMFLFEKRYWKLFEYKNYLSNKFCEIELRKFWEIELRDTSFMTTWGVLGTPGISITKEWHSATVARAEYNKIIRSKQKKGYEEVKSLCLYFFNNPCGRFEIVRFNESDILNFLDNLGWKYYPKK